MSVYFCPVCGSRNPTAYVNCQHPLCPDGRDQRTAPQPAPERQDSRDEARPYNDAAEDTARVFSAHREDLRRAVRAIEPAPAPAASADALWVENERLRAALRQIEEKSWHWMDRESVDLEDVISPDERTHYKVRARKEEGRIAHAALAQPEVVGDRGWRPIETAPKDGTVVLLSCDGMTGLGWWADERFGSSAPGEWRAYSFEDCDNWQPCVPVAWMPAPEPLPWGASLRDPAPASEGSEP